MDRAAFEQAFATLQSNPQFVINEYKEDHLIGTIDTVKGTQMIQTTIPYDKGWKVYVDGVEVETYETLEALIAFDISSPGSHTLEMKYRPGIYTLGAIFSITGTLLFVMICVADLIFSRFYRRKHPQAYELLGEKWLLEDFDEDDEQMRALPPANEKVGSSIKSLLISLKPRFRDKKKKDEPNDNQTPKGEP